MDAALREADTDHDGGISLAEFREMLTGDDSLDLYESRLSSGSSDDE